MICVFLREGAIAPENRVYQRTDIKRNSQCLYLKVIYTILNTNVSRVSGINPLTSQNRSAK